MATYKILNRISMTAQGIDIEAKQGPAADAKTKEYEVTVTGTCHKLIGVVAADSEAVVFDDSVDVPATWDKLFFWASGNVQLQLLCAVSDVVVQVTAYEPFTMSLGELLAASGTTLGGTTATGTLTADATLTDIKKIVVRNTAGADNVNWVAVIVD